MAHHVRSEEDWKESWPLEILILPDMNLSQEHKCPSGQASNIETRSQIISDLGFSPQAPLGNPRVAQRVRRYGKNYIQKVLGGDNVARLGVDVKARSMHPRLIT